MNTILTHAPSSRLRIGFVINPYAGVGGPTAFKGSDANFIQSMAKSGEIKLTCPPRAKQFSKALAESSDLIQWVTVHGAMGSSCICQSLYDVEIIDYKAPEESTAEDTKQIVGSLLKANIDILIFMGGDGTARDVCSVLNEYAVPPPSLGIPAGVKMHSGVYAINPLAGAELIKNIIAGHATSLVEREVRDIDEALLQQGKVRSRHFGDMLVPEDDQFVQQVKQGGGEEDEISLLDIASEIRERMDELESGLFIFGPGSTTHFILNEFGFEGTLLGVDVVYEGKILASDVNAGELEKIIGVYPGPKRLIITAIGGQGHILGRGNQQLSPSNLKEIGKNNLWVVLTRNKLRELNNRPLLMDSGSPQLDRSWSGLMPVISGYNEQCLYRLGFDS